MGYHQSRNIVGREIAPADLEGVAECLVRNFPRRGRRFWRRALNMMGARPLCGDRPRYGQLLDADGRIVGVLLQFTADVGDETRSELRCNLSSWCADPDYRSFSILLHWRAVRDKSTTYLNVTSAPHTRETISALGFRPYASGCFEFAPLGAGRATDAQLVVYRKDRREAAGLTQREHRLLADHAAFGLHALVGIRDGYAAPFVVQWRPFWRHPVPTAQIVFSRSEADIALLAPALGRYCARFGRFRIRVGANGPIPGLRGRYSENQLPRFYRGPVRPAPYDVAYTEIALLGI
jgi:hypothetical protein